jgi:4a-hydroxytetrahydrobiopterin dehydratase
MLELVIVGTLAATVLVRWLRSGKTLLDFTFLKISRVYSQLWHRWSNTGMAPIPRNGPVILVCNHTCSADPMFLQASFPRLPCYLSAAEHYNVHPFIRWVLGSMKCVPVTRNGRDVAAARRALRRLEEGHLLCIFPEGNLSGVAKQRMRVGKHGAALLALRTRTPVYPAYIAGGPQTDDLLEAWLWPPPGRVQVIFGPAIDLSAYYDRSRTRQVLQEVTALLMDRINALQPRPKEGLAMKTTEELTHKHCVPCEGGIPALPQDQVQTYLKELPGWHLSGEGRRIRREWRVKDFEEALDFFNAIGKIAEAEGHHPDLHLTGYRDVAVEIYTHAVGGLTENDFILAAKITRVPVAEKR